MWEPVLKTDIAPPTSRGLALVPDPRAAQYWDPALVLSKDFVRSVNENPTRYGRDEVLPPNFVAWDVVAVFDATAHWDRDIPVPAYYGGPVVHSIDDARKAITDALAAAH